MLKIIFMGSPAFAIPALKAILNSEHEIVAVYTQAPKPAGRGQKESLTPVHQLALNNGINVFTPHNFKDEFDVDVMRKLNADIAVVAAYGLLLPRSVLETPKYGCINIHPSLLPRWRGAAPIHRTIMAGDQETAVCIMRMDEGLDTGDVIISRPVSVGKNDTTGTLHDKLADIGAELTIEALGLIESGNVKTTPQSAEGVTYAKKISKHEARIDWNKPVTELLNLIRGLNPYPGAYFEYEGERIKILNAIGLHEPHNVEPGTVVDDGMSIAAIDGFIMPSLIQRPGKKALPAEEALKGFSIPIHTRLS